MTPIEGIRATMGTCYSSNIQLFHGCLVNSQNYSPEVPRTARCTIVQTIEAPRGYGFDYSPNIHEITVLLPNQHVTVLTNGYEISIH